MCRSITVRGIFYWYYLMETKRFMSLFSCLNVILNVFRVPVSPSPSESKNQIINGEESDGKKWKAGRRGVIYLVCTQ